MADTTAPESVQKDVAAIVNAFFQSLEDQDYAGIDALFHRDGTMFDLFEPELVRGPEGRGRLWVTDQEQFASRGRFTWSVDKPAVDVWGESTAVATYHLTFAFEAPNPVSGYLRMTDVLRRVDGRWLIVHHYEAPAPTGAHISEPGPT